MECSSSPGHRLWEVFEPGSQITVLKLDRLLLQPLTGWDHRPVPPCLVGHCLFKESESVVLLQILHPGTPFLCSDGWGKLWSEETARQHHRPWWVPTLPPHMPPFRLWDLKHLLKLSSEKFLRTPLSPQQENHSISAAALGTSKRLMELGKFPARLH